MPRAYTTTLDAAISNGCALLEELRDELQETLDAMPRDRAKWSEYADQIRAALNPLNLIEPPPKLSELVEYLGTTELTCYDFGKSLSMRRDNAIDQVRAAIVLLEERAKAFRDYSAVPAEPGERPPGFVGPWTPQDYDRAAAELECQVDRLEAVAKRAEDTVFLWES